MRVIGSKSKRCSVLPAPLSLLTKNDVTFAVRDFQHLYDEQLQIDAGTGSLNTKGPVQVTNTLYVRLNGRGDGEP